ncbi:MAG: hypothetical protein QNK79_05080 [Synechococcus sp. ArSW.bin.68]
MNLRTLSAMALITGASVMGATPGLAQDTISASQVRAINLARNTAVAENGGLTVYRPQQCMFQTSDGGGDCLVNQDDNGYTFQFLGGAPGWPQNDSSPTTETEIQIAPDGRTVNEVLYNGSPR